MPAPDPEAAAVHRANAQRHYLDAEKARQAGDKLAFRAAMQAAWQEDDLAEALSTGQPPRLRRADA
jgi:hypothetical protein